MSTILAKPRPKANTLRRGPRATTARRRDDPMPSAVEYTPLHAAVAVPSDHADGTAGDLDRERFIANEMLLLCDTPGKTSTRVHLETFLQDLLDDKRCRYDMAHSRYDPQRVISLFTKEFACDDQYQFWPGNNRLLLLYRSGDAPVLGVHMVYLMVKGRIFRHVDDYLAEYELPIYAEDVTATEYDGRFRLPIPKLLTVDLVDEIRRRVEDVAEIWLQFPVDRAPFLIVVNRHNQYDYLFGDPNGATLDPPWSDATTLRFRSSACGKTRELNGTCGPALYHCEEVAYYGRTNESRPIPSYRPEPPQRACDLYLDHLYNGFVISGHDEEARRCQLQMANPGSGVVHCDECAHASAKYGGMFYHVQYAPLTSNGPCPIARYVLCTLSKWYEGTQKSEDASEFDVTTPVVRDVRMALRKRRVLHKVLAVDAIKKGADPAPGTTAFAAAMGRAYGTRYGQDGHVPFGSVDDCLQSPDYHTNKMLHYFAKGFNDATGRPLPEWGREGDMDWRRRVCESLSAVKEHEGVHETNGNAKSERCACRKLTKAACKAKPGCKWTIGAGCRVDASRCESR